MKGGLYIDKGQLSMGHICIYAFVPSKAGLTKEVVFHEGGLSKEVLLYVHCCCVIYR